ncbi:MAG: hypothetical protein HEQ37_13285 [Acidovorax sp.]|jgi:hypothetical protein|nr:hypothetical protein [Acidovorax sp.]
MKSPGPRRLLFVTYGGGHAHMVYPVVHALRASEAFAQGQIAIDVLGLPAATYTLTTHGIDCLRFSDFVDPALDADAIAWGEDLARQHHSPTVGVSREDSIAYLGLNYKDLVLQHGEAKAAELFAQRGRQCFLPLHTMARIFDRLKPDFVITSNSPRAEAAALAVANERSIPSLAMTDLFTGLGGYMLKAGSITFLNQISQEMFLADGLVDPGISEFHVTGNPAFDKILALPHDKTPGWMERHFPGVGARKAVLHADMPAWWDAVNKLSYFKTEADSAAELQACYTATVANGAAYLVRPHPSQDRAFYERWLAGRDNAYLAADACLHELLANVDLLLARSTTVGLEAALMRKRILQLQADLHPDLPLAAMGVAWGSRGYAQLPAEIERALGDDAGFQVILAQIACKLPMQPAALKIASIVLRKLQPA